MPDAAITASMLVLIISKMQVTSKAVLHFALTDVVAIIVLVMFVADTRFKRVATMRKMQERKPTRIGLWLNVAGESSSAGRFFES